MQKNIILALCLFFPFLGCYGQNIPLKQINQPERQDPYFWDFGRVKEGAILQHVFTLKNESSKDLNIKDVNTSCGCTVSKVLKRNLSPGESTPIEVEFNTKGYVGIVTQYVYINTDNLDNQIIRLIIKADVYR